MTLSQSNLSRLLTQWITQLRSTVLISISNTWRKKRSSNAWKTSSQLVRMSPFSCPLERQVMSSGPQLRRQMKSRFKLRTSRLKSGRSTNSCNSCALKSSSYRILHFMRLTRRLLPTRIQTQQLSMLLQCLKRLSILKSRFLNSGISSPTRSLNLTASCTKSPKTTWKSNCPQLSRKTKS